MTWPEFCSLLSGIMPDTPLGMVVAIRAERNPKAIMNFTPEQKRIRNEWIRRRAQKLKEDPEKYKEFWANFQAWAKAAFKKGGAHGDNSR